jgi:membrane-bound lytic murein transglycosylase D
VNLRLLLVLLLSGSPLICRAQEDAISLPELIQNAQTWAQENLDTNVLKALEDVDQQKVEQFWRDLQRQFQSEYIVDLAALRSTAESIAPLLESHPDTRPYAVWLRTRLDYLQVADDYERAHPPPKLDPGIPFKPAPNPTAEIEREIWVKKIVAAPWPAAASNHVARLKPIFTAQKVPPELVWVAEVESSFDPGARSPAGAAGLFQLMPDTAKRFGLSLWPRDQRLQADRGAAASAQYLKYLHDRFKDWRLTLAAYNAGEGTVQKLLDRYKTRSYDAIATHLPAETQLYVPKVEATVLRREGVKLSDL